MALEMKDSGVEWIGSIPFDWQLSKIGQLYSQRIEKVSDKDFPPLSVTMKGILPQLATAAKTDDGDNRKLVRKGDFCINSRSDRRGSCGISSYDGSVSLINIVLVPQVQMNPDYYDWLFHTSLFADEFYKWGHGIVDDLWTTRWQEMKSIVVPVPKPSEQVGIAEILNCKCAQIDAILEKIRLSIEEYKKLKQAIITQAVTKGIRGDRPVKDSGVSWIGTVPSDWIVTRFSHLVTVKSNLVSPQDYLEFPQVSPENIEKSNAKLLPCKTVRESGVISGNHLFFKGQILYSKIRPKLNKVCIAPFSGLCSADMYPIGTAHNTKFVVYIMLSDSFVGQVSMITEDRVKMPKINQDELGSLIVAYPPDEAEQQEIVEYLDAKCAKIDALIEQKARLLSELEAYKKSLIYEYVTGKKEAPQAHPEPIIAFIDARALLMCRIIELLKPKGRIHLMKALFCVDCLLDFNRETQYLRQKHGPYDERIEEYEKVLVQKGWASIKSGNSIDYFLTETFETYREAYQIYYGNLDAEIQRICEFLRPMKTSQAERVATLLAVWNDFIIDGFSPTDKQIVQEVRSNWTPNKANSPESTWMDTLTKMKTYHITPLGYGKHTAHMNENR